MGDRDKLLTDTVLLYPLDEFASDRNSYSTTSNSSDTITVDLSQDTITFDSIFNNMSYSGPGSASQVWTTMGVSDTLDKSGKVRLEGADADIEINGVSLWATMQEIANRLNIMQTNSELETEWTELRELGDRYRALEQHIRDKQATFDRIKAMPAPDID